ncbi:AAA family ATPase [Methylobacterium sp. Leaf91]|uniref:AAA family ATPase n=1 Tax=Methylobacterium sp. Leaf91 TaxID=1736247 RepID=UPI001FCD75BD|nr:AAA family ATPase [Methylobacterium sp. Leaf91]
MTAGLHEASSTSQSEFAPGASGALPTALTPLVAERRWLVWKWELNDKGKPTKVPYRADAPSVKGSSTDSRTWADHSTAAAAVAAGRADGIGYALHGGKVGAFDLDHCRDRETQEIAPWALKLLARAKSYAEVTPSGEGIRILGFAEGSKVHRRQRVPMTAEGAVETFRDAERFITVTGDVVPDTPATLAQLDAVIDETVAELDEAKRAEKEARREAEQDARRESFSERAAAQARSRSYDAERDLPRELDELVRFGPAAGADRSAAFHHAVCWLKDYGWSVDRIEGLLSAHPNGVAEKYEGRLRGEIERCWDKAEAPRERSRPGNGRGSQQNGDGSAPRGEKDARKPIPLRWHRDANLDADRPWLVRDLIAEVGKGLLSGQWGSAKTFIALDLSGCVMTGEPFAGRNVMRRGGVLFIAPEGAFEIPIRLKGLVSGKVAGTAISQAASGERPIDPDDMPFAWIEECPRLVDRDAADLLMLTADAAVRELHERYDLPLALIIVDTVAAGAGFDDENSAAETQKVMNALERLSHHTGAFVLGVDHFGKAVETGTRGSSAKEAAADTVLAALASRDEAGNTSNMRMAVRKVRGARTGQETPYSLEVVQIGEDRWGDPVTTCVVNWEADRIAEPMASKAKDPWTRSLKVLRSAILNALAVAGSRVRPFGGEGPEVLAARQEDVRQEFYAAYPTEGDTEAQRADARKKAFKRALLQGVENGLIATRDVMAVPHVWLVGEQA